MIRNLFSTILTFVVLVLTSTTNAQGNRFVFAVTNVQGTGKGWNALRKLDVHAGKFSPVLLNGADSSAVAYDVKTKKEWKATGHAKFRNILQTPFGNGVAAAAYDAKNDRFYFTPMYINQLRYIDLKTMKLYYVTDQSFAQSGNLHNDPKKIITRMVITSDGIGYASSNDGYTFIRFTTEEKVEIRQLTLNDDASNSGVSIHNYCSCAGGDMVSDDKGNLYVFSSRNNVFKVDPEKSTARLVGYINGLPKDFTTDGAAVTADGKVLISSMANGNAYYMVDPKNWNATKYEAKEAVFRSSDLASGNYLQEEQTENQSENVVAKAPEKLLSNTLANNNSIQLYPNPATTNQFNLQLGTLTAGNYTVELISIMGQRVAQEKVQVQSQNQVQSFVVKSTIPSGIYLVKITGADKVVVYNQKIVLE